MVTMLFRDPTSSPELHELRICPLPRGDRIIVPFQMKPLDEPEVFAICTVDEQLTEESVRVIHQAQDEVLIDAVPLLEENACIILGKTPATPLPTYWLRKVSLDRGVGAAVPFLEGAWPVGDETRLMGVGDDPSRIEEPLERSERARYRPICLCGGSLGDLNRFAVITIREDPYGPDTNSRAVSALFVHAENFESPGPSSLLGSVWSEVVMQRQHLAVFADWNPQIRCSGVNWLEPYWHVGVRYDSNVQVFGLSSGEVPWAASPRYHSVSLAGFRANEGNEIVDYDLATTLVDTSHLHSYGEAEIEACAVITQLTRADLDRGYDAYDATVIKYLAPADPTVPSSPLRERRTRVESSRVGYPRLIVGHVRGSRFYLLHLHGDRPEYEWWLSELGGSGAVVNRRRLPVSYGGLSGRRAESDLALAYDPKFERVLFGGHYRLPTSAEGDTGESSDPAERESGVAIGTFSVGNPGRASPEGSIECGKIGPVYRSAAPPLVGRAPFAGHRFFEIVLEHGPHIQEVRLVISGTVDSPSGRECVSRLDASSSENHVITAYTDASGFAVARVPLDETGLGVLVDTDTDEYRELGEINVPSPLFAQWQWFEGQRPVERGSGGGLSGGIGPLRRRLPFGMRWPFRGPVRFTSRASQMLTILPGL